MKYRLIYLILACAILTENLVAQSPSQIGKRIDSLFGQYSLATPGVAVGVVQDGELIFKKGYGSANLEYDIPISPGTVLQVGSVSKQFTAFAIYLLENEGKLSLDDDIRKYLPEVPDFGSPITIAHLCNHTSGFKEELALLGFAGWRMDEFISADQILRLISRQKDLNFKPGTEFKYSNTNYTLLTEIVKRVSGQRFSDFTSQYIFEPLGMINTQFHEKHEKLIPNRAYSYDRRDGIYEKEIINSVRIGSTGLFTTVEDMLKWTNNFYHPKVGDAALIKKFNQPATLDNGELAYLNKVDNIRHAKGQFLSHERGLDRFIHTGSHAGFKAFFGRFPSEEFAVILLSNDGYFNSFPAGIRIAEMYLENKMTPKEIASDLPSNDEQVKEPTTFDTNLTQFLGTYCSDELSTCYDLKIKDGILVMEHLRLGDLILQQIDDAKFSGRNYYPFQLEFLISNSEKIIGLNVIDFRGEELNFTKA